MQHVKRRRWLDASHRMRRFIHRRIPLRLVVLSCCESGIAGQSFPGDEFLGVLPALLQCGAHAAIGTLWAVYDDAARLLVE